MVSTAILLGAAALYMLVELLFVAEYRFGHHQDGSSKAVRRFRLLSRYWTGAVFALAPLVAGIAQVLQSLSMVLVWEFFFGFMFWVVVSTIIGEPLGVRKSFVEQLLLKERRGRIYSRFSLICFALIGWTLVITAHLV